MSSLARCDLHIHSLFSDSDDTVERIVQQAQEKNLKCIALTDHDTVAGIALARQLSQACGIELISGIEFSAKHQASEVHILGYFIDENSSVLKEALLGIKQLRKERLQLMAQKLDKLGVKVDLSELFAGIKEGLATRLHLGAYLTARGYAKNLKQAFRKYLSPKSPAYVSNFRYNVQEAIELIKASGGLAFLAHPHLLAEQAWLNEFIGYGLNGLEIIYPYMPELKQEVYRKIARENNLLISGGSDAHGSYKEFTKVGEVTISYDYVMAMKQRLKK